jgi:hypothetical protein
VFHGQVLNRRADLRWGSKPAQVLASFMRGHGAQSIIVTEIESMVAPSDPLYARLIPWL